jgi:predicted HTH transcriptional regulator
MSPVGQREERTQKRVVTLFREQLGYDYLGDWTDRACNRNIEQDDLRTFLRDRQSYDEALFLARYIEKYGTGTLMMICESLTHALPEPDFTQRGGEFTITLWRDRLTGDVLAKLQLNNRQLKGLACLRAEGRLTSGRYQELTGISRQTASRDLEDMVKKGILNRFGDRRGTFYGKANKMPQL